ncbi:endonuclease domain of the non-LTR retrotransposon LINE-1 [Elysia marginata]|uniref:Endonuclease domain of the non-LTR retrotransposon LINE-1 n=1 Tax=Elysia marginata TaxID=1093978 RepID=A0AAV4J9N3_9GAST|nr:endonuclease domain of the non-LTR retrotransposon LINE-1 [Elysia marginata]
MGSVNILSRFSETSFAESAPDSSFDIDNFCQKRSDRTKASNKSRGGGTCLYVNEKWCHPNNVHVKQQLCTPDLEMLIVVLRPFYPPREFTKVTVVVYVHSKANTIAAMSTVTNHVHEQQSQSPDGVLLVTRDFNAASLKDYLLNYQQYVDMPTRRNKTLDLCYGNAPGAYKTKRLPELGNSDHCMVSLLPKYRPKLKTLKVH